MGEPLGLVGLGVLHGLDDVLAHDGARVEVAELEVGVLGSELVAQLVARGVGEVASLAMLAGANRVSPGSTKRLPSPSALLASVRKSMEIPMPKRPRATPAVTPKLRAVIVARLPPIADHSAQPRSQPSDCSSPRMENRLAL